MRNQMIEKMWGAVAPDRSCIIYIEYTRDATADLLLRSPGNGRGKTWKQLYREGWRIVPVTVKPRYALPVQRRGKK